MTEKRRRGGYEHLKDLIANSGGRPIPLPFKPTVYALGRVCYEWMNDLDPTMIHKPGYPLYRCMYDMLEFISTVFQGGTEFANDVMVSKDLDNPGHELWLELEETNKFSKAVRFYWDCVLQGKVPVKRHKKHRTLAEQAEILLKGDHESTIG